MTSNSTWCCPRRNLSAAVYHRNWLQNKFVVSTQRVCSGVEAFEVVDDTTVWLAVLRAVVL